MTIQDVIDRINNIGVREIEVDASGELAIYLHNGDYLTIEIETTKDFQGFHELDNVDCYYNTRSPYSYDRIEL